MIYAAYVRNASDTTWCLIGFGVDEPEAEMKIETRLKNMATGTKSKVVAYKNYIDAREYISGPIKKEPVSKKPKKSRRSKKKPAPVSDPKGFDPYKHLWIESKGKSFIVWNEKQTRKLGTFDTLRGARRFIGFRAKEK